MKGISVSEGIALGKALLIEEKIININKEKVPDSRQEKELFHKALSAVASDMEDEMNTISSRENGEDSDEYLLLEAHMMMASDEEVIERIEELIDEESISASWAVDRVFEEYRAMFESMDDEYLSARAADCMDIKNRILTSIQDGGARKQKREAFADGDIVLVAKELFPSDMLSLDKSLICGIITEKGSRTSHISILARNMNIPAIMGADIDGSMIKTGDEIIVNGDAGEYTVAPSAEEKESCREMIARQREQMERLRENMGKPAETCLLYTSRCV